MKLLNIQNKLLTILLGLTFVLLILWNRLRIRLPRNFDDFVPDIILICSVMIIITVFLFAFGMTVKSLLGPPKTDSLFSRLLSNSYVMYSLRIKDYIMNAPYRLYEIIFNTINLRHFLVATASPLVVHLSYPKLTYTIFFLLPRIIVSTIFAFDLCYNRQFTYFYNSLILLLIPLLIHFYLFMLGHLATVNIIFIDKHLDIERSNGEVTVYVKSIQPLFEDAMDITNIDLPNLMKHRLIFKQLLNYAYEILTVKKHHEPYVLLYTSICYVIGWSYYLWFLLNPSLDTYGFLLFLDTIEPFSGSIL